MNTPAGISIAEQKCYLLTPDNAQAIIDCLDNISSTTNTIGFCVLGFLCGTVFLLWRNLK